jgi:hypothetical protein
VYEAEEVQTEVKVEVVDPGKYQMLVAPLMHSKHKAVDQLDNSHHQHRRASSITEALHSFPSASKKMAMKHWHVTYRPTLMPQIPL